MRPAIFSLQSYGWFTEGIDTVDLKEAKTPLDELHASQQICRNDL
jgi:hypothetical protein